jgi:hypothetical protein
MVVVVVVVGAGLLGEHAPEIQMSKQATTDAVRLNAPP